MALEACRMHRFRKDLHSEHDIRRALGGIWRLVEKEQEGTVTKEDFKGLNARIAKALIGACNDDNATEIGEKAWEICGACDQDAFNEWLLSIADLYCGECSGPEYLGFLTGLKLRITEAHIFLPEEERTVALVPRLSNEKVDSYCHQIERQMAARVEEYWSPFVVREPLAADHLGCCIAYLGPENQNDTQSLCDASASYKVISEKLAPLEKVSLAYSINGEGEQEWDSSQQAVEVRLLWDANHEAKFQRDGTLQSILLTRFRRLFPSSSKKSIGAELIMLNKEASISHAEPSKPDFDRVLMNSVVSGLSKSKRLWVVGLPLTGKTSVAKMLAQKIGCTYLGADELTTDSLEHSANSFTGYVLDGGHDNENVRHILRGSPDAAPQHVLALEGSVHDILQRIQNLRIDPDTNTIYPGAQWIVAAEKKRTHEAAVEEKKRLKAERAARVEAGEEEEDPNADEEEDPEQDESKTVDFGVPLDRLKPIDDDTCWDTKLKFSSDTLTELLKEKSAFEAITPVNCSQPLPKIIKQVYGQLTDADIEDQFSFPRQGFEGPDFNVPRPLLWKPAPTAEPLEPGEEPEPSAGNEQVDEQQVEADEPEDPFDEEAEKALRRSVLFTCSFSDTQPDEQDNEADDGVVRHLQPPKAYCTRFVSPWMYTCPVTTSPGRAQFSVLFQGHVYFCSSKASMDQFILSPQEYAGGPKETPGRTLFVVDEAIPKKTANGFCDRICEVLGWVAVNGYSPSATLGQQLTKNKSKWLLKVRSTQVPEELRRIFERGNMMPNRIVVVHEASQESEENGGKRYSRPAWTKFANELGLPFIDVPFQESSMLEILNFGNAFSGYDVQNDHLESITSMPEEDKKVALEGQLGMSGKYCPVTLQREKMLIPGKPTITACYQNATYCFIDEDARLEFQISPQTFVSQSIAGDAKPKPIIMVLGLPGSGKTMVAEHLKQKVGKGIDIINAQQLEESILAKRALLEESKATPDSQQEETESKDESKEGNEGEDNETTDGQEGPRDEDLGPKSITEEEWLEMITERIKNSKEHGTIIDGDVLSTQENAVQLLVNNNLHPTVVVDLRIEESLAVSRTLEKTFQWEPPEPEPVPVPEATEDGEEPAPPVEQPPPPTKEELTEMEQAAKDAATADISSIVQARAEILTAAFGTLKEAGINICKSVNMNGDTGKMHALRIIAANVQPYTSTVGVNGSISLDSHRAVVVDGNIALEMLKAGFIRQIPFADYCPVTWASQNYRLERAPARMKTNPVVYEGKLYHFLNETNLNMFLANPSRYALKGDFDLGVRAKCRCAVLGEPLSGKSTLAKGLRDSLGLVVVTPRGAVEYVLDQANLFDPHSGVELMFGKEVQMKVPPGELSSLAFDPVASLGIELVVKCIQARCTAHDAILNGYVLDGFPTTEHEAALLKEDSILDTAFILSDIPHSEKLKRSLEPIADVNRISKGQWIDLELAIKSQVPKCFYLNACNSPWSLVKSASCVLNESLVKVNRLFCNNEVEAQLTTSSPLCKSLSPMELVADKSMLVPTSGVTFCPVTFVENGSLERITPGNVVHLNGELYGFASQHQMIKFVGSPEAYVSALEDLKTRVDNLPPSPESVLEVGDREGYLKQTVSPLLCRALEELGIRRLKHPGLSVSETCSKFVALYLRANNSNVHQVCKKKREQTLAMFLEECELHDKINNMAATGTGIRAVRKKKETREEEDAVERYNKLLCQPISILTARLDIQHR